MNATDFDHSRDLKFSPQEGRNTFGQSRLVIFDANAIGVLRQNLIGVLGFDKAREFFLMFGFQHGYSDFLQMKLACQFDSEMDLLASGPVIHSWEGIVNATPTEIRFDRGTGDFFFTGGWRNSYEAEQHLLFNGAAAEPVCRSLMGYASGWCTAFFGSLIIGIEPQCVGKGDANCGWKLQPPSAWGEEAKIYVEAYRKIREDF
jgi:hypothetical protein